MADDAERWLAGLTAVPGAGLLDDSSQRLVGEWAAQIRTVPSSDIATLIDAARRLVAKHGWAQGQYGWPESGFSVVGAVEWAAHVSGWLQQRAYRAERAAVLVLRVALAVRGEGDNLSAWNDDLRRQPEEIEVLLAEARVLTERIGGGVMRDCLHRWTPLGPGEECSRCGSYRQPPHPRSVR
ncbi:hypothetical protein MTQ13_03160 [Streptomyces sp. XM4011]|uniref:DUF6197 family protein n=1 Tax=Streptomyces sp. XM4011 TaxID=2929780 RepID=UPI001FF8DBC0|nr:hypothetical protein [Streptomyces sp. XM4011]MCK1813280.1 hypothetical protein [Streptomyces sp. XM4011]